MHFINITKRYMNVQLYVLIWGHCQCILSPVNFFDNFNKELSLTFDISWIKLKLHSGSAKSNTHTHTPHR